jgi:hypothetical protein
MRKEGGTSRKIGEMSFIEGITGLEGYFASLNSRPSHLVLGTIGIVKCIRNLYDETGMATHDFT